MNITETNIWQSVTTSVLGLWLIGSTFLSWIPEGINKTLIGMIVLLLGLSINERWQGLVIASLGMWLTMTGIAHGLIGKVNVLPHSLMLRILCGNTHDIIIGALIFVFSIWASLPGKPKPKNRERQ